ncbi:porphobilinogen deaminase [Penicillium brevicompactum]|uniref:Porphobilinogen deaminase n=1 Tax=Penicillium brevicompactum TaxID=5074 RepID=A0A9W9UID8_PENBR|nr:porphobilinogen deaminase [Penicillium brevicompactum]
MVESSRPPLRIGTRRSKLAIVQAETIRDQLKHVDPSLSIEIETLHTAGDRDKVTALPEMNAKSLWTTELEEKLTSGELDVIVHCLKGILGPLPPSSGTLILTRTDMPTATPETCELAAIPARDDARDALIVKSGLPYKNLKELPEGSVVGTSSVRRSAQLRRLYPHLKFANLRGNVETRLAKVDDPESEYTCMIMSAAGLQRLGLQDRIDQYLGSNNGGIFHAVGQGALGLEIRKGDVSMQKLLEPLSDQKSTLACLAERELLRTLEGGCSVPIGVETEWVDSDKLKLAAIVVSLDGSQSVEQTLIATVQSVDEAGALGKYMAIMLIEDGAEGILKGITANRPSKD